MTGTSVTVREPEFTADDVAALIASRRRDAARRGPHGYTLAEAMDPKNQFGFELAPPKRDWAMKALHDGQELFYRQYPDAKADPSWVWDVQRREPQE